MFKKTALIVTVAAIAVGGWLIASPYMALASLKSDIQSGNAAGVIERIDFPKLRDSAKNEITRLTLAESPENQAIAIAGAGFVGLMIDQYVTPAGVEALVARSAEMKAGATRPNTEPALDPAAIKLERTGLTEMSIHTDPENPSKNVRVLVQMDGLGWKISGVSLPDAFTLN